MPHDLPNAVKALRHITGRVSLSYEIWWTCSSKTYRREFSETLEQNYGFFEPTIHAHFVAVLVGLYSLYETRKDTYNIGGTIKLLSADSTVSQRSLSKIAALNATAKPLWVKISVLRNNAFGHRSADKTIPQIFKDANVRPNEIRRLIEITKRLLNVITKEVEGQVKPFDLGATFETVQVLKKLRAQQ